MTTSELIKFICLSIKNIHLVNAVSFHYFFVCKHNTIYKLEKITIKHTLGETKFKVLDKNVSIMFPKSRWSFQDNVCYL